MFLHKKKRHLRVQECPQGHLWYEPSLSAISVNYTSVAELEDAVKEQLLPSGERGQALGRNMETRC